MTNIRKIMVPVSFAPSNDKAMKMAADIAASSKAKLYILNVYKTLPQLFYSVGGNLFSKSMEQERVEKIEKLDQFVKREVKKLRLSLDIEEIEIKDKHPIDAIIEVAKDKNVDLIVLGHHEESKLEHFLFGNRLYYCKAQPRSLYAGLL